MTATMSDSTNTTHPDWCESSSRLEDPGCHDGPAWPKVPSTSGTEGVRSVNIGTGLDAEYGTVVFIEAQGLMLTPEQAREAGLALLSAASWAKAHKASS